MHCRAAQAPGGCRSQLLLVTSLEPEGSACKEQAASPQSASVASGTRYERHLNWGGQMSRSPAASAAHRSADLHNPWAALQRCGMLST
jgi:hypothetical protein